MNRLTRALKTKRLKSLEAKQSKLLTVAGRFRYNDYMRSQQAKRKALGLQPQIDRLRRELS